MDFQSFTETVAMPCCVISVEKKPGDTYGEIRILCSNQSYKETMGPNYHDGMLYYELVPKDTKFEDICYRAAVCGEKMHAYVETTALGTWTDQTLVPLEGDETHGYCQFIFEFTKEADPGRMASMSASSSETVLKACIDLASSEDFQRSVSNVLEDILIASRADACRVMLANHEEKKAIIFAERVREGAFPERGRGQDVITYELMSSWEKAIGVSNALLVKTEREMAWLERQNPAWVATMRKSGVNSLVLIPLRRSGELFGYLYVVNFDVEDVVETKELLERIAFFLSSELFNHLLMTRLETLSNTDALTGLLNRNALKRRFDEVNGRCFGIVNLDLNGLKYVNDNLGHEAGDEMLNHAAAMLHEVFRQEDIFRTGGDEFVAFVVGISKETFEKRIKKLYRQMEADDVSSAVGTFWSDGTVNVKDAYRLADENMYEDKKHFYSNHPDKRRP